MGTVSGRWVITAAGARLGVAFLDSIVKNVALPAIAGRLPRQPRRSAMGGQRRTSSRSARCSSSAVRSVTCSAGAGSLRDRVGRVRGHVVDQRRRTVDRDPHRSSGVPRHIAALLHPGKPRDHLGVVPAEDRGRAIGAWSGLAGVTTAVGPFLGGYLIDSVSWRLVFLINLPVVAITVLIARGTCPRRDETADRRVDVRGDAVLAAGLAGAVYADRWSRARLDRFRSPWVWPDARPSSLSGRQRPGLATDGPTEHLPVAAVPRAPMP